MIERGDEVDRANDLAERATADSIYQTRRKAAPEQHQNEDGSWPVTECDECGLDIEPGRIAIGKIRCFTCQSALEAAAKLRGRR